jgi:hypothetical protein
LDTFVGCFRSEFDVASPSSTFPILLDSGCSYAMTFDPTDFETQPLFEDWGSVQTASGQLSLTGFGRICWQVVSDNVSPLLLRTPGFLVPGGNLRILSPQDYCRHHRLSVSGDHYGGHSTAMWLLHEDGVHRVHANVEPRSNLPYLLGSRPASNLTTPSAAACGCHTVSSVLDPSNINLTPSQKLLLLDHH